MKTRRKYSNELKQTVIELLESGQTAKEIAVEYDLKIETIKYWNRVFKNEGGFGVPKKLSPLEIENRELKKKLRDSNMERDILKKALSIFS